MKKIKSYTDKKLTDLKTIYYIDSDNYSMNMPILTLMIEDKFVFVLIPFDCELEIRLLMNTKINYFKLYEAESKMLYVLENSKFKYDKKICSIIEKI